VRGWKPVLYVAIALGMVLYALPRLAEGGDGSAGTAFAIAWLVLALAVIASNLYELFAVDRETRKEVARVKRLRRQRLYQRGR